ncbi:uncharacterized protein DSM5745_10855 [Aspergillus mulundensis]|uniref:Uncharacterized protein n=1 Tax=Aspergillus mulundensis TaxID=1810919 RepID=A0A3D8QFA8_9EURO|nr:hypothetical protein DSM5745_10855 [Aspergillus mulundensis]RDW60397.1 hypothetical protein DSM5745_10855 [Aspergillus mulundensis]
MSGNQAPSDFYSFTHVDTVHPKFTRRFEPISNPDHTATYAHAPEAGDNDPDIYTYEGYSYANQPSIRAPGNTDLDLDADADPYVYGDEDGDADLRVKTTSFDNGEGSTVYDPESGAYDQILDYTTGPGGYRHHRERMTEDGVFQARDVVKRGDGSRHVHREYDNPGTGTRTVRDYER